MDPCREQAVWECSCCLWQGHPGSVAQGGWDDTRKDSYGCGEAVQGIGSRC